ncbi:MAG TPA: hypothetical protein VML75_11030 [Kofleriaceae bacterium]|nr:hypothetical protein [Kofleriaceae bacterium]
MLRSVGAVKDAALRGAEAQRVWIDGALLGRKRRDVVAELGEKIYEGVVSGALRDLEAHPELAELIAEIDDLEVRMEEAAERTRETTDRARRTAAGFAARAGFPATGLSRRRTTREPDDRAEEPRVWRPVMSSIMADQDDGTVSALSPLDPHSFDDPFDDAPATAAERPAAKVAGPQRQRRAARGRGGIQFVEDAVAGDPDDDADLEQYMHPDDVPDETP